MPPEYAAEMIPIDPMMGEFRAHYAGFFDPGFGYAEGGGGGSKAVLEVRTLEIPFVLEHGQTIARLVYDELAERPTQDLRPEHRTPTTRVRGSSFPSTSSSAARATVRVPRARHRPPYWGRGCWASDTALMTGMPGPPAARGWPVARFWCFACLCRLQTVNGTTR